MRKAITILVVGAMIADYFLTLECRQEFLADRIGYDHRRLRVVRRIAFGTDMRNPKIILSKLVAVCREQLNVDLVFKANAVIATPGDQVAVVCTVVGHARISGGT